MKNDKFTAYEAPTGRVLYGGTAYDPAAMAVGSTLILVGETFTDGWLDSGLHYSLPDQPSLHHAFNWQTKQWEDLRTLQDLKDAKRLEINTARETANWTLFPYAGQQIAVDRLSRGDIDATNGEIMLTGVMPVDWVGGWKTLANTYVAIPDVATWREFYLAMTAQGKANFTHSQALKTQLAAATTIEEVEAIVW